MIEMAEKEGKLKPGDTIIEVSSGNTGIGLAGFALLKKYNVKIMISTSASKERSSLLKFLGAEVLLYNHDEGRKKAIERAEKLAKDNGWFFINQYSNQANVLAHKNTAEEILASLAAENIIPDYLVLGIGTGGTITGISKIMKEKFPNLRVIGIIPENSGKIDGIRDFRDINPKILDLNLVDNIEHISEEDSKQGVIELARVHGLLAGFSSGAAFIASKRIAEKEDKNIITIFPDGIEKYLSYI